MDDLTNEVRSFPMLFILRISNLRLSRKRFTSANGAKMIKNTLILIVAVTLSACAGNRNVVGDFNSINKGHIEQSKILEFVECVSDHFKDRQTGIDTFFFNRQQRRSDGYRIELVSTTLGLVISADVFEDGRVELFETSGLIRVRLRNEREGFAFCLNEYRILEQEAAMKSDG